LATEEEAGAEAGVLADEDDALPLDPGRCSTANHTIANSTMAARTI
jgi:hypothetical protein